MDNLIAQNVSRIYDGKAVVANASLILETGKLTALVGGSGAGKSTLLRLFAGLEPVDTGTIHLGEALLSEKGRTVQAEKRAIGLVFQDFALFPHLTAAQNVRFGLKHLIKSNAISIAHDWLERLGLQDRIDAYPHQLSGGEQQRVSIARALAPKPAAILMDEPFSGLDPALREGVRAAALAAIAEAGIPALLVTHDASEAMAFADHLAIMQNGKILQQGTPEIVYTHPVDLQTAAALGPVNLISDASSLSALLGKFSGVREEGVRIDPNGPVRGKILSVRRVGASISVVLDVEGHGPLKAKTGIAGLSSGDDVNISFDPALSFRF